MHDSQPFDDAEELIEKRSGKIVFVGKSSLQWSYIDVPEI